MAETTPPTRLWEIEGLRAVAAWSIVIFHVWVFTSPEVLEWNLGPLTVFVPPLQSGVTLFFVLSGFLLYRPIASAILDATPGPRTSSYLRNRALRLLPAYWVVLVIAALVFQSASLGASGHGTLAGRLTEPKTLLLDVLLVHTYLPQAIFSGILPSWSLTVEVAFYVLLPCLGLTALAFAQGRPRCHRRVAAALGPVLLMVLLGVAGKLAVALSSSGPQRATSGDWHAVLDRSLLTHADLFGFGMGAGLILLLWERGLGERLEPLLGRQLGRPLAYVGLPVVFLGYYLLPAYAYDSAVAVLAALGVVRLLASRKESRTASLLTNRWMLAAGRRSYSVFLWNYPVLAFLSVQGILASGHEPIAFALNLVLTVSVVVVLSALTYRFVEAPALRLKSGRRPAAAPTTPATQTA
jgi:peptidoglycan/LPS O-acetylase OafA/YrhL